MKIPWNKESEKSVVYCTYVFPIISHFATMLHFFTWCENAGTFLRAILIIGKLKRSLASLKRMRASGGDAPKQTPHLQRSASRSGVRLTS